MAEQTDVLICGSGSAGLCAAVWLARYGVPYRILERRPGPMEVGQADGVQCRTVEIFEGFGISEELLREAYHVLEVAFWAPTDGAVNSGVNGVNGEREVCDGIRRTHFAADTLPGLSHLPHVILNQARINGLMIELLQKVGKPNIEYGCDVQSVEVDMDKVNDPEAYCVKVVAKKDGVAKEYRAKYVLGCDGAHSSVRRSLGYKMIGDSTDTVWGVMDVYPLTDFPDIRKKTAIHSSAGMLLIVPREGDDMVRFYLEQPAGTRAADVTREKLHALARAIFHPYRMDIAETAWWSGYAIGQRLADNFHKEFRVFLTGDACHTHSPKAGQGMNVSLQDGFNVGWKLGMVLTGQAVPALLETYVSERKSTAAALIDFDRSWTRLFSSKYRKEHNISAEEFRNKFVEAGKYTAGLATRYAPSSVVMHEKTECEMPKNLFVGERFPSAQVVRFCDAKAMPLAKAMKADCRWRIVVFAGDIAKPDAATRLEAVTNSLSSMIQEFTPAGSDANSAIEPLLVFKSSRTKVEQGQIPDLYMPVGGLTNVYVDDESYNSGHGHAYDLYGVHETKGALVVVRPDQYIAGVLSLDEADLGKIRNFFGGFLLPQKP